MLPLCLQITVPFLVHTLFLPNRFAISLNVSNCDLVRSSLTTIPLPFKRVFTPNTLFLNFQDLNLTIIGLGCVADGEPVRKQNSNGDLFTVNFKTSFIRDLRTWFRFSSDSSFTPKNRRLFRRLYNS